MGHEQVYKTKGEQKIVVAHYFKNEQPILNRTIYYQKNEQMKILILKKIAERSSGNKIHTTIGKMVC